MHALSSEFRAPTLGESGRTLAQGRAGQGGAVRLGLRGVARWGSVIRRPCLVYTQPNQAVGAVANPKGFGVRTGAQFWSKTTHAKESVFAVVNRANCNLVLYPSSRAYDLLSTCQWNEGVLCVLQVAEESPALSPVTVAQSLLVSFEVLAHALTTRYDTISTAARACETPHA
jgi:hypothetical protein